MEPAASQIPNNAINGAKCRGGTTVESAPPTIKLSLDKAQDKESIDQFPFDREITMLRVRCQRC
jgi:hypothetical protein